MVNKRIGLTEGSLLDDILESYNLPKDIDFMSINIDGLDFWVFDSLKKYQRKVVIIEFNPTIPLEVKWVQERNFALSQGVSALAINDLGISKSYTVVAATHCNIIFVKDEHLEYLNLKNISKKITNVIAENKIKKIYLFSTYDGKIFLSADLTLPWHGIRVSKEHLQVLPQG